MTAAYAFIDYRSEGQTLPYVIVDIGSPPTFNVRLTEKLAASTAFCSMLDFEKHPMRTNLYLVKIQRPALSPSPLKFNLTSTRYQRVVG